MLYEVITEDRFQARIDAGKIRDCHGDMHSANICLSDPVNIFDCIEFNERFRYTDVAADVAFLAMDLDFHGETDRITSYNVCYTKLLRSLTDFQGQILFLPNLFPKHW